MRVIRRSLAFLAVVVLSALSLPASARSHQWGNAFVSAPGCLASAAQNGTGNLYNACGGSVLTTLPGIIDSTGYLNMTVSGYVTGDSWCWITVVDQTSTNFYQGYPTHFQYQNAHTTQRVYTPAYLPAGGAQSMSCQLAGNSYLFTVNY